MCTAALQPQAVDALLPQLSGGFTASGLSTTSRLLVCMYIRVRTCVFVQMCMYVRTQLHVHMCV